LSAVPRAEALNARLSFKEFGGSMIDYLEKVALLGPRLTLAYGVWLDQSEIEKIAAANASVVLNLLSNLKNKNGVAPIRTMIAAKLPLRKNNFHTFFSFGKSLGIAQEIIAVRQNPLNREIDVFLNCQFVE
jgi:hypothetical protein